MAAHGPFNLAGQFSVSVEDADPGAQIVHDDGNILTVAFVDWRNAISNKIGYGEVGGLMPLDNMRICERWWRKD